MKYAAFVFVAIVALIADSLPSQATPYSVLTYHGDAERSGHFVIPQLTWDRARSLHLDPAFHAELSGNIYAQPLYWQPPDSGPALLIAVTEDKVVHALDPRAGHVVWKRLGDDLECLPEQWRHRRNQ